MGDAGLDMEVEEITDQSVSTWDLVIDCYNHLVCVYMFFLNILVNIIHVVMFCMWIPGK